IDERRSVEKILSESEANYRNLVEGANSVILRWAGDGTIIFLNRFGKEFFGYTDEEIVGRNIVGTIVPETDSTGKDLSALAADIAYNPQGYVFNENENVLKNGQRVWVSWTNKSIIDSDGKIVEILSVGNDITRRKVAEDLLKITLEELASAKERAEAADRLKSAFLATMSHELRTPLNSIIGFTGIILGGYVGPLNDEQAKQLGMVRNSANHLLSLINDVLDISKIEAGQLKVSVEPFSLKGLIDHVAQSSRPALESKKLALSSVVPDSISVVRSDRRRVEQILLNLISNAVKFTEQGGITIECSSDNGSVIVSVTDTGMGIREEDLGKLFNAFQQVDSGITRRFDGTGLGLYICKKLLDLLGGTIWVTSTWGIGSTFSFTLPVRSEVQ
ncbi:MAG TPA: ATP-binding protein, partial [Syntrophorhabdaceae bacterium]|nr:ATP-binding protein [Syntrophorhabdaceae bacterium]